MIDIREEHNVDNINTIAKLIDYLATDKNPNIYSAIDAAMRLKEKKMILTKEQVNGFEEASKPLIKWICDNCHPHVTAIVDCNSSEILESSSRIKCEEFIKD